MSIAATPNAAENTKPKGAPAPGPAVIRRLVVAEEDAQTRMIHRQLPAFVISGALHVVLIALFVLVFRNTNEVAADSNPQVIDTTIEEEVEPEENLFNTDVGFDAELEAVLDLDREEIENVEAPVEPDDPIGTLNEEMAIPTQTVAPPGLPTDMAELGGTNLGGDFMAGQGLGGSFLMPGMRGRSGATKNKLLAAGGGNSMTEAAVARGLAWLAKQQKANGMWVYDGTTKDNVAATGMALLPFLAAGVTHKQAPKEMGKKYIPTVRAGLAYLSARQKPDGNFQGATNMYSTAIATMAMCEAYGMTRDPTLKSRAQAGLNFIMRAQGRNGSWGYKAGNEGDTSIVGWQIQALKSGKLSKLSVDDNVLKRAEQFLVDVSTESESQYGYRTKGGRPSLTAVGLLCRQYLGWGPRNPSLAMGVDYLKKRAAPNPKRYDLYTLYYATQVVHFFGGPDWHQFWNKKMQEVLLGIQEKKAGPNQGSWPKDGGTIGSHCGRLGSTCLALLTLEVYYRYLPLYKRDASGAAMLEM